MIKDFILPDIGEGVVECELVDWLVAEGDTVVEDQPIADVMTDKALVQIPAPNAGVITKLYYAKGDIAIVHAPLYSVRIADDSNVDSADIIPEHQDASASNVAVVSASGKTIEDFLLPDIGEGIVECELVDWLVAEGEMVVEDQPIADVMTDKALVQIPAMKAGKIVKHYYRKGQLAKVHSPLFAIEVDSEFVNTSAAETGQQDTHQTASSNQSAPVEPVTQGKALASPAVRRLARSLDINIAQVQGSGKHGRYTKKM
ncbi:biotin/lipoyl-containing protein [Shewanella sp. OMA3-2]|uniref:biotin/lipoyl-containing protein n=1 Tax=Shewanella sp. OMA3-2 TaxID=2908650 RepID=UPI003FA78277